MINIPYKYKTLSAQSFLYMFIILSIVVVSFPLVWMTLSSFKPLRELFTMPPTFLPKRFTLYNYAELLKRTNFEYYFLNSVVVALASTVITILISTMAAYSVTRFNIPGGESFMTLVLFTYMFPPILLAIPIFIIMANIGLADTYLGLVFCHITFAFPFSLWLLWGYFKTVPLVLEEAALVDGATRYGAFFKVTLPLAYPGIIATSIFSFLMSWNDYIFALIMIHTESKKTLPLGTAYFLHADTVDWGLLMSASVVITFPVFIFFLFVQKYLIQGFGAGAVKG